MNLGGTITRAAPSSHNEFLQSTTTQLANQTPPPHFVTAYFDTGEDRFNTMGKPSMIRITLACIVTLLLLPAIGPAGKAAEIDTALETIRSVGSEGKNNPAASQAWGELVKSPSASLIPILAAMQGANPLARNYLRAAFDTIAARERAAGKGLPLEQLRAFLANHANDPAARRMAFEAIVTSEPQAKQAMLADALNDPSLEIRYDAIAQALEQAVPLKASNKPAAIAAYETILASARNESHIKEAAKALRDLGETVELPLVFGFIMDWKLIGPFDSTDGVGFAAEYPPEQGVDLSAKYEGKQGTVAWLDHITTDEYGMVDLNKALTKHMGAVGYAYHQFESTEDRPAELRLGCINANKVWLNGELLIANEVYHSGSRIDQYVGQGRLRKGKNEILVKVIQNEQTENWAQDWQFQLRVCDHLGTAILSQTTATLSY